jgi:hypothetical protein
MQIKARYLIGLDHVYIWAKSVLISAVDRALNRVIVSPFAGGSAFTIRPPFLYNLPPS